MNGNVECKRTQTQKTYTNLDLEKVFYQNFNGENAKSQAEYLTMAS